jgi:hypothetical protein
MQFQSCTGDAFEVRWNVMQLPSVTGPSGTLTSRLSLLTVSSRQTAAANSGQAMLYSPPVTVRTLIEN